MFLYSGHENNIASILELLNLRKNVGVPSYGSQVLIELHKINETYGIKVGVFHFYKNPRLNRYFTISVDTKKHTNSFFINFKMFTA